MPEHIFTVAARGHVIDAQTNTLTLFCVIEQLGGPVLPLRAPELCVITLWGRRAGEEDVQFVERVLIRRPDDSEALHVDLTFRLEKPRIRTVAGIAGLPIEQIGRYCIEVLLRRADCDAWGAPVAQYPIEVSLTSPKGSAGLFESGRE